VLDWGSLNFSSHNARRMKKEWTLTVGLCSRFALPLLAFPVSSCLDVHGYAC
jgi:hypothetical protein